MLKIINPYPVKAHYSADPIDTFGDKAVKVMSLSRGVISVLILCVNSEFNISNL